MEIQKRLKELRKKAGITQEQLADKLFVSRQTISNWEAGKSLPDVISIIKLSEIYNVCVDELLKEDPKVQKKIEKDVILAENNKKIMLVTAITTTLSLIVYFVSVFVGGSFNYFCENAIRWVLTVIAVVLIITILFNMKINKKISFTIGGLTMKKLQILAIILFLFGIWLVIFPLASDSDLPEVGSMISIAAGIICCVVSLFGKDK